MAVRIRSGGGKARATVALLIALPCLLLGVASSAAAGGSATASATTTFVFDGGEQTFTVPDGVTSLEVLAVGGRGDSPGSNSGAGGFGAAASAKLPVSPGQVLFIEVGGNGGRGNDLDAGFNGGGSGAVGLDFNGGGGGGASDIRTISRAAAGDTLGSRLIIAGGGGGGGGASEATGGGGGDAGLDASGEGEDGLPGDIGAGGPAGGGGLQTGGGSGSPGGGGPGTEGQGGNGGPTGGTAGGGGGGGGGGTFGGGGGSSSNSGGGGGGSGSSSFAPTVTSTTVSTDATGLPLIRLTYNAGGDNKSGLKFGKVKLNKQKGTATLPVTVPGSGDLTVGGKGVVKKRPGLDGSRLARKIDAAGTYTLKVKAKGKKKAKLFDTGKVKVKAVISFKPTSGDKVSDSKRIKLKKN